MNPDSKIGYEARFVSDLDIIVDPIRPMTCRL